MNSLIVLRVIRVHIVAGGVLAFSLGALLAILTGGIVNLLHLALGYSVVFLGDLSTHFSNDYFDVELDRHQKNQKLFSNKKILVNHPNLSPLAKKISLILLMLSNVLAGIMVLFFGAPTELFIITFLANLLGWAYSAPPMRLSAKSLGELAIALATGFIIPSIGYLSVKGQLDLLFVFLSIPFMMYGFFLSLNLEIPDIKNDQKGQKTTFAVRIGPKNSFYVLTAITSLVTLTFFVLMEQLFTNVINLKVIFFLSLIPLTTTVLGFLATFKNKSVNQFCSLNIIALFLFIISLNAYFFLLLT
ncbi:MAG: prenyltransferase [Candidatus Bathyarchaeota archaeon]|nr:MAG: prenyltransferase [Candidatus Bathyarchaeota archaeon]